MNQKINLTGRAPTWQEIVKIAKYNYKLELSDNVLEKIQTAREVVDTMSNSSTPYYGINTGLGALCNVVLARSELQKLSYHTLMSHASGIGNPLRKEQVRAIMSCAITNYSYGYSGISPSIVKTLVIFLNENITPIVPEQGSVGYLTHMAHIGLALIGHGKVEFNGEIVSARQAMHEIGIEPLVLEAKDGLSLVNGTPAMTGIACIALENAHLVSSWADIISAMSLEILGGQIDSYQSNVLGLKKFKGVQLVGENIRSMLTGSEFIIKCRGHHLQDALSLRSIAQVHGACIDQLEHVSEQINRELSSATDNPLVIQTDEGYRIISQANPHGESVAMSCDILAIAICEWSSISERRIYRLVTPHANSLPAFLTTQAGIKSGFMIAQYSAASLVADNKKHAHPSVIDNYMTSGLQEDHLSFGDSAALKLDKSISNTLNILAIEYLSSAQAHDLVAENNYGLGVKAALELLREHIQLYEEEHPISIDVAKAKEILCNSENLERFKTIVPNIYIHQS